MLQKIREKLQGWVAFAVIAIIAVPLVLTFASGDLTVTGANFAARVNGEDIPSVDFQRVYQNRLLAEQEAARAELDAAAERRLKEETLDSLVLNRAVTQFVRDAGYRVSSTRVVEYVRSLPVFQVAGQFSKPAYDATLAQQGLSALKFEEEQRTALAVQQLEAGLSASAFYTPAEFRRLIELDLERRDFAYVVFEPAQFAVDPAVSDADVQAYYTANAGQFQSVESADLEYIELLLSEMAPDYVPDEDALRAAYEADTSRFRTPDERRVSHILLAVDASQDDSSARALADKISAELAAGGNFAELAAKYSNDPGSARRGGELGIAGPGAYPAPFEQALLQLKVGEVSPPVKTEFGYHLIRLDELRPGGGQPFEAVRETLASELRQKKAQDEFYALAERMDDLALENPSDLEPVAKATGLPIQRYAGYTRTGGGPFADNANLVAAVFTDNVLEGGENTPLVELDDRRAVVARVSAYRPATTRPLAEVRAEIVGRLTALRAATEARARGESLVTQLAAAMDPLALPTQPPLKWVQPGPLTRRTPVAPPDLLAAVFRAPVPDPGKAVVQGTGLSNGAYAVFVLRSVQPGNPESIPQEQRDQRKRELAQRAAASEAAGLAAELRASAEVRVAPDLFKDDTEEP